MESSDRAVMDPDRQRVEYAFTVLSEAGQLIWNDRMTAPEIAVALSVICGDVARAARDNPKSAYEDLSRELGNLIVSAVRWCGHLNINPIDAADAAFAAQRKFNHKECTVGPYCNFCDHRCFVTRDVPNRGHVLLATCPAGMKHDRESCGYDHTTAVNPYKTETRTG